MVKPEGPETDENTLAWLRDGHAEWQISHCHCISHPCHPCPTCKAAQLILQGEHMAGKSDYHCDGCGADVPYTQYDEKYRRCVTCVGQQRHEELMKERAALLPGIGEALQPWLGPMSCPACDGKKFLRIGGIGNYLCDSDGCGWQATEEHGERIGDKQRQGYTVEEPDPKDPTDSRNTLPVTQGATNVYSTGAKRDSQLGKGRFELNPFVLEQALARRLEEFAPHYGRHNWRKGIPITDAMSSAKRHLGQAIEVMTRRELDTIDQYTDGMEKEDHWGAALFNIGILIQAEYDAKFKTGYKIDFTNGTENK